MGFPSPQDSLTEFMRVCECVATLSNRPGIFLETRGARGNNWACSAALNRSLSTELHVPASWLALLCAHPSFLLIYPKKISFVTEREVKHMLAQSIPPPLTVSPSHTHTHTYIEGEHQQLVFSLCFSRRAALILPDKGWESQENISTHTNTRAEMCHATITHAQHTATHLC